MSETSKVSHALIHAKEGFVLKNVKFFVGDDRNTSLEEFGKAVDQARSHVQFNSPIAVESFDDGLKENNIKSLL